MADIESRLADLSEELANRRPSGALSRPSSGLDGDLEGHGQASLEEDRAEVRDSGAFTLISRTSLAFQISQRIGVQFSFVDNYDSEAESRGARSNNDGQLFFGVVGTFRQGL